MPAILQSQLTRWFCAPSCSLILVNCLATWSISASFSMFPLSSWLTSSPKYLSQLHQHIRVGRGQVLCSLEDGLPNHVQLSARIPPENIPFVSSDFLNSRPALHHILLFARKKGSYSARYTPRLYNALMGGSSAYLYPPLHHSRFIVLSFDNLLDVSPCAALLPIPASVARHIQPTHYGL